MPLSSLLLAKRDGVASDHTGSDKGGGGGIGLTLEALVVESLSPFRLVDKASVLCCCLVDNKLPCHSFLCTKHTTRRKLKWEKIILVDTNRVKGSCGGWIQRRLDPYGVGMLSCCRRGSQPKPCPKALKRVWCRDECLPLSMFRLPIYFLSLILLQVKHQEQMTWISVVGIS